MTGQSLGFTPLQDILDYVRIGIEADQYEQSQIRSDHPASRAVRDYYQARIEQGMRIKFEVTKTLMLDTIQAFADQFGWDQPLRDLKRAVETATKLTTLESLADGQTYRALRGE